MEAYRMLLKEYQPTNRARSLELFHNILNYRFAQNKGIAENILEYEEKIEQYEKATGEKVQENLKVSTLIQGMKPEVKRHLLLNMDEKTKYSALRQYLVNYESTERWTNSLSQGSGRTTTDLIEKGEDHGGLAMMDVSQAWYKGKGKWYKGLGKGKGKGKGKGGKDFGKGFGFEGKGKGKGKGFGGFGKGRGRGNWKGRGRGFRGYKGKGKGRGKGNRGFKGKGKGKAQAATGVCHYCHKYGHFEAQCRQKQRDMGYQARNVDLESQSEQASTTGASTQAPSSGTRTSSQSQGTQGTQKPVIRLVSMYHMGDQPTSFLEEFELSEDSEEIEIEYFGRVLRVEGTEEEVIQEPEEFWIGDEDDEYQENGDELDAWYHQDRGYFYECPNGCHLVSWHPNMQECEYGCHQPPRRNPVDRAPAVAERTEQEEEGTFFVRAARRQGPREIEVVLDSGADISLAPMWMKRYGRRAPNTARIVLRDAQGSRIRVSDQRIIEVEFKDTQGNIVKVEEVFLISSVVHPLLAVGKLLKKGWEFRDGSATGTFLTEGATKIAVNYNNNSLTARAFVRAVNYEVEGKPIPIHLCENLRELIEEQRIGWTAWRDPYHVHYSLGMSQHVDTYLMFPPRKLAYRAVLINDDEQWYLLHHSVMFDELEEPFGTIFDGSKEYETLTLVSTKEFPLNLIGSPNEDNDRRMFEEYTEDTWSISMDGKELVRYHISPRKHLFNPRDAADIPVDIENLKPTRYTQGEEPINKDFFENDRFWTLDEPLRDPEPLGGLSWTGRTKFELFEPVKPKDRKPKQKVHQLDTIPGQEEQQEEETSEAQAPAHQHELAGELSFTFGGHEYNQQSSLKALRELCRELGVPKHGSKQEVLRRLSRNIMEAERHMELATSQKKYKEFLTAEPLKEQRQPKPEEVAVHNLTHLPYASWCPVCVACKGKESPHLRENPEKERSSRPTFCMDFCFTGTSHDEAPAAVSLVCVDSWSRSMVCIPTATKGKDLMEHLSEGVTYLSTQLQYGTINPKADNEGTMMKLKQVIQKQRANLGLGTVLQDAVSGQKETNGMAERAIQTIRWQGTTFIKHLEERTGTHIAHTHPLFSWSFRHAAWTLNRYRRHKGTGVTPYEWMAGRPYEGQLAEFGESLMVLTGRQGTKAKKGDPIWQRGVFLGKTENNLFITWHMDGIKTSRSAKRCTEHFDVKAISSVGIHTWEVKHTTLTTRAIPRKNLPGPVAEAPPLADGEPSQKQPVQDVPPAAGPVVIQGGDPAARQGPTRTTYLEGKARKEQAAHKRKAEEELEQEHPDTNQDEAGSDPSSSSSSKEMEAASDEELIPDSSMASELISARAPPQLRKLEFEDVGTGSKIPKVESPQKRYPPFNVGRVFEHNDEELPEPDLAADDIFWEDIYSELGDSDDEDLFRNEDSGPPELAEEQLQELDREAMATEINRLTEMKAVVRKTLQELERTEERENRRRREEHPRN